MSELCREGLASSINDAQEQPAGLALDILWDRAYARTKHEVETRKMDEVQQTPLVDLVWEVNHEIGEQLKRERAARRDQR